MSVLAGAAKGSYVSGKRDAASLCALANELPHALPTALFTFVAGRTLKKQGYIRGLRYKIQTEWCYREVKRAATAIGRQDLTIHDLRHVAGTRTLMATKNLRITQHLLGHARSSTTTKYAHVVLDDLRAAMETTHKPASPKKSRKA